MPSRGLNMTYQRIQEINFHCEIANAGSNGFMRVLDMGTMPSLEGKIKFDYLAISNFANQAMIFNTESLTLKNLKEERINEEDRGVASLLVEADFALVGSAMCHNYGMMPGGFVYLRTDETQVIEIYQKSVHRTRDQKLFLYVPSRKIIGDIGERIEQDRLTIMGKEDTIETDLGKKDLLF